MMQDFKDLFARYAADQLTPEEAIQWLDAIAHPGSPLPAHIDALLRDAAFKEMTDGAREEALFRRIMSRTKQRARCVKCIRCVGYNAWP
ncbi:MAG TPA: hypothetical protein VGC22_11955 [Chitinophaga sp.]